MSKGVQYMFKYLCKRIGRSLLTLVIILIIVFSLLRLMPIEGYFPNYEKMTPQQIQVGLREMGLTDPLPKQIVRFFGDLLQGDMGTSRIYRANVPVSEILADKVPISIKLGVLSMLVSLCLGIPLGALMARYKFRFFDKIGTLFIICIEAVPAAIYFLYIQLYGTQLLDVGLLFDAGNPKCWILPVFSMSLYNISFYGMWLRRYMVDESNKDYVKLARAKGVSESGVMFKHIFRNAFVPLAQYIPTAFLNTVIGSIYIESLYSIPGMGGLLVTVVKKHDNTMVQGIVLLYACVGVLGLLLGDLLMVLFDPRISLGKKEGDR
jgi:oligopeptide transport system permease protein